MIQALFYLFGLSTLLFTVVRFSPEIPKDKDRFLYEEYQPITKNTYDQLRKYNYSKAIHKYTSKSYVRNNKKYFPNLPSKLSYRGIASYYGDKFHGRQTSSFDKFNKNLLTAASPTLPMGTWVKVYNLKNKKSVVLKINDRGPFIGDRILDVSEGAAIILGFKEEGTTDIIYEILDVEITAKEVYNNKKI